MIVAGAYSPCMQGMPSHLAKKENNNLNKYSRTPIIRTPIIQNAYYPNTTSKKKLEPDKKH